MGINHKEIQNNGCPTESLGHDGLLEAPLIVSNQFTPQAEKIWEQIPTFAKTRILNNVWCGRCMRGTIVVHYTGSVEKGDFILRGKCERCDGDVARLIERE